jgi:GT2 family glycosyltransferase/glycosyltransferase involved in cell wall biosynthesis
VAHDYARHLPAHFVDRMTFKDRLFALLTRFPSWMMPTALKLRVLARSGLLSFSWYRHATRRTPASLLELARGVWTDDREGVANPLFSADWYRDEYRFAGSPGEALLDYILRGERLGRKPCAWFDPVFFRQHHPDVPESTLALAAYWRDWQAHPHAHPHFDGAWYQAHYADVAALGVNPLAHFVTEGRHEGREPNAYFDSRWYLETHPDIAASGMPAIVHFSRYGAGELRNPGPGFDMAAYAAKFPEYRSTGLDPLAHFLLRRRTTGFALSHRNLSIHDFRIQAPGFAIPDGCVDIIVPVYRNLSETRRCIASVMGATNRTKTRLRIINDASPEPEVTAYLRGLETGDGVLVEENPENLGFVGTVTRGMRAALAERDCIAVLLLNSDTEVANDWVDRMVGHAIRTAATGSVTAFSNNATICSYPKLGENAMPDGIALAELDRIASEVNAGVSVDIPTGVGFCMLIPRAPLEVVGLFDEAAFGRGYGEENDFCLRATAQGFVHLLATDVFVEHVGEVSFAQTSGEGKQNASRIILERYPDYHATIARHVALNPAIVPRLRLTFGRWAHGDKPVVALVTHDIGGGTERQVLETCRALADSHHVVVIKPKAETPGKLRLENRSSYDGFELDVVVENGLQFAQLLHLMGVGSVQLHHLYGHAGFVRSGLAIAGIPFEFHVHDYYTICPQITLTTEEGEYCGEPGPEGCNACIARRPTHGATDIINWRDAHGWALLGAERVIAPSHDAADRMRRYHPVDAHVRYHECPVASPLVAVRSAPVSHAAPLRVVLLGVLAPHKGKHKVLSLLAAIASHDLPIHLHLVGHADVDDGEMTKAMAKRFTTTGWYKEHELEDLMRHARADVFLFASTAPETYSFTLTAAMSTGMPIAAPAHGAYPERLARYPHMMAFPVEVDGPALAMRLLAFAGQGFRTQELPGGHG